jgi:hypothetical protein
LNFEVVHAKGLLALHDKLIQKESPSALNNRDILHAALRWDILKL